MRSTAPVLEAHARFAEASVQLQDSREAELVHRIAECERVWSSENALRFVRDRNEHPILMQYGSGLTPLVTGQTWKQIHDGLSVTRSGKAAHDSLVQRLFFHGPPRCLRHRSGEADNPRKKKKDRRPSSRCVSAAYETSTGTRPHWPRCRVPQLRSSGQVSDVYTSPQACHLVPRAAAGVDGRRRVVPAVADTMA